MQKLCKRCGLLYLNQRKKINKGCEAKQDSHKDHGESSTQMSGSLHIVITYGHVHAIDDATENKARLLCVS